MNYLKKIGIACGSSLISLLLLTFLITLFHYWGVFGDTWMSIMKVMVPILSFMIGGFLVGRHSNKKGWLEGLGFGFILLIFVILFNYLGLQNKIQMKNILFYTTLPIASVLGGMIGINKKRQAASN